MKRLLLALPVLFLLSGCDNVGSKKDMDTTPEFVKDARVDVNNTVMANIIRDPDFKCRSLYMVNAARWTLGCFKDKDEPYPFLLFAVESDSLESNPPFKYKLLSINGNAKQYSETKFFKMFKVEEYKDGDFDVGEAIKLYIEAYPGN